MHGGRSAVGRCTPSLVVREVHVEATVMHLQACTDGEGCNGLAVPSVGADARRLELSVSAKQSQSLWKSLAVSHRVQRALTVWPSYPTPRRLQERKLSFVQSLHTHRLTAGCLSPSETGAMQVPFNHGVNTRGHVARGNEKEPQVHFAEWEKPEP